MVAETIMGILGTAFLGSLGWAFTKTEDHAKRIVKLETANEGLKELIVARFDSVEGRLDRIETKQDGENK